MARPIRPGPLLMMGATLVFALMVWCVKEARTELSALEIVAWRGIASVPMACIFLALSRRALRRPTIHNRQVLGLRCFFGFLAMLSFFTAAKGLSVADLTLITRVQPLVVALAAPLVLGAAERASGQTWGLLVAGLLGCAILLGPNLAVGSHASLWALAAVLFSSAAHLCLRALGSTDHPAAVVFWFQVVVSLLALAILGILSSGWTLPTARTWPYVLGVGVLATLGQWLMTRAYALEKAAVVSGASHVGPVWAIGVDLVFFRLLPSLTTLLGGAVVMGAVLPLLFQKKTPPPSGGLGGEIAQEGPTKQQSA